MTSSRLKPPPPGFAEVFTRWGWRGVEIAYGSRTTCNRRWIEELGGEDLKRRRAEYAKAYRGAPQCELARLDSRACHVRFAYGQLMIELTDGRSITAPVEWFPALARATPPERQEFEIRDDGKAIEWSHLGERVTVAGMLALPHFCNA